MQDISIRRQCELLGVNRSSLYYAPERPVKRGIADKQLMDMFDAQYSKTPFYGSRRMARSINLQTGGKVNRKRVQRLMRLMGIEAIYPRPNTSKRSKEHQIYPYLLSGMTINSPGQVWGSDITYIRLEKGFAYLVAIIDWHSRKVLSWRLSNTMDTHFCIEALEEAFRRYGPPEYFNTDQGAQFTATSFITALKQKGVKISMDGKGRAIDNVFTERLWRSIKYENVYIKGYQSMSEAKEGISDYIDFYNKERIHSSHQYHTPDQVFFDGIETSDIKIPERTLICAA
jgi:putative transposase